MDATVTVAVVAGVASIVGGGLGVGGTWIATRGQARIARAQITAQARDAERDDARNLVELANQLAGSWIDRLAGEVDRLRDQLYAAEGRIVELTTEVKRLTDQVRDRDELRAQLAAVTAERDQLIANRNLMTHGGE